MATTTHGLAAEHRVSKPYSCYLDLLSQGRRLEESLVHVMKHRPTLTTVDVCLKHPAEFAHNDICRQKKILKVIIGL